VRDVVGAEHERDAEGVAGVALGQSEDLPEGGSPGVDVAEVDDEHGALERRQLVGLAGVAFLEVEEVAVVRVDAGLETEVGAGGGAQEEGNQKPCEYPRAAIRHVTSSGSESHRYLGSKLSPSQAIGWHG